MTEQEVHILLVDKQCTEELIRKRIKASRVKQKIYTVEDIDRVAELEKDAERLDWLQKHFDSALTREAIDQARADSK